jgi:hypothetical protein
MTSEPQFQHLLGTWSGTKQVWPFPDADEIRSASMARLSPVAQGQFILLSYTWESEGQPQDGMIVFPSQPGETTTKSVWLDSWHTKNDLMHCEAALEGGIVSLKGSYPAPPGPDWGWRIEIDADPAPSLAIHMFNITPEGQEALAVLIQYEHTMDVT